jgi:hypothetical protein
MVAYMARIKIPIADIRPTQLTLGLSEVTRRAAKIAKLSPEDREAYFERKAIPHVIGPGKRIYIVNHHHLARALWSLDVREAVLGDQLADWSDFEIGPFWRMMESSGFCWSIGSGAKFRKRFNKGSANTNRLRQRELHSRLRAPCCLCSEVRRG